MHIIARYSPRTGILTIAFTAMSPIYAVMPGVYLAVPDIQYLLMKMNEHRKLRRNQEVPNLIQ